MGFTVTFPYIHALLCLTAFPLPTTQSYIPPLYTLILF